MDRCTVDVQSCGGMRCAPGHRFERGAQGFRQRRRDTPPLSKAWQTQHSQVWITGSSCFLQASATRRAGAGARPAPDASPISCRRLRPHQLAAPQPRLLCGICSRTGCARRSPKAYPATSAYGRASCPALNPPLCTPHPGAASPRQRRARRLRQECSVSAEGWRCCCRARYSPLM